MSESTDEIDTSADQAGRAMSDLLCCKSLNAEQRKCIGTFKQHMKNKVVPAIVDKIHQRQVAAANNRHRILKTA